MLDPKVFKAYDVRGVVPDQWDEPLAELFGAAFVQVTGASAPLVAGHPAAFNCPVSVLGPLQFRRITWRPPVASPR